MSISAATRTHPLDEAMRDQGQTDLIIVGVSAATGSESALRWAADEAERRRGHVRAVMAWKTVGLPGGAPGRPPAQSIVESDQQQFAQEKLEEFVAAALGPDHDVECQAIEGGARTVLLGMAEEAAMLVLDSPRVEKLIARNARRLAPRLIFKAPCPVVVMPPPAKAPSAQAQETAEEIEKSDVQAS